MRGFLSSTSVVVVISSLGIVSADCSSGSQEIAGNWYCQPVNAITYQNFGSTGTYNKITNMDPATGSCSSEPFEYSGSLAPLNEEVSMHFRGPLNLRQFAVYVPAQSASPVNRRGSSQRRHNRAKVNRDAARFAKVQQNDNAERRAVGDMVTATINGVVVSWVNQYAGPPAPTAAPAPAVGVPIPPPAVAPVTVMIAPSASPPLHVAAPPVPVVAPPVPVIAPPVLVGATAVSAAAQAHTVDAALHVQIPVPEPTHSIVEPLPPVAEAWAQIAYYQASAGIAQGITFLNNKGGQGSGTFDLQFGNSVSYASADGCSGSASPQILADGTLPSNEEFMIMTDRPCEAGDCGFVRPGGVAYHGFGGGQKIFLLEFGMPDDGTSGWNMNMPAIWMLNAQIPRTLQYGKAECSCWVSGCGEFDLFEVLDSGNTRCKSTVHGNISGGSSDYFERPTSGCIKAAIVMSDEQAHIKILDNDFSFTRALSNLQVQQLASETTSLLDDLGVSTFVLNP